MKLNCKQGDLFDLDNHKYFYVHCISADCALGAGIARVIQSRYNIKHLLKKYKAKLGREFHVGEVVKTKNIINLVTKNLCFEKPTYGAMRQCLTTLKNYCVKNKVTHLAMPTIGSGLDKLSWGKVKAIIIEVFNDTDITIEVRYL
jgi:O-acetyl-ADP-ribose deacetylase (regulator of RNase III)